MNLIESYSCLQGQPADTITSCALMKAKGIGKIAWEKQADGYSKSIWGVIEDNCLYIIQKQISPHHSIPAVEISYATTQKASFSS